MCIFFFFFISIRSNFFEMKEKTLKKCNLEFRKCGITDVDIEYLVEMQCKMYFFRKFKIGPLVPR